MKSVLKSPFRRFFGVPSSVSRSGRNATVQEAVFSFFDRNGDGRISSGELRSRLTTMGSDLSRDDAEAAIAFSDSDGDGFLSVDDFRKLTEDSSGEGEELKKAFEMYCTEPGSGIISPCSLKRMMSRLGEAKSMDDCKAMIRPFDINGDGLLSFDEFSLMMR